MSRQLEMNLKDPKHPIHGHAVKLVEINKKLNFLRAERRHAIQALAAAMMKHKKFQVNIDGMLLTYRETESTRDVRIRKGK